MNAIVRFRSNSALIQGGVFLYAISTCFYLQAQTISTAVPDFPEPTVYKVSEQGMHSRVWQRVLVGTNSVGRTHVRTNSYTELATGMAHPVNGQLIQSSDQIQITATGAQATNSLHLVRFLGNINSSGAVDITMPDGQHLTSNPLGIAYFDTAAGKSVMLAEIKDSFGLLLPSGNEAAFPDAFTDFRADVLYKMTIAGLEQFVILRERPPSPSEWGLDPATTVLQVITEFLNPPKPALLPIADDTGQDLRIDFGTMQMVKGAAFAIGAETNLVPVTKQWQSTDARTFLIEEVPLQAVAADLESLDPPPVGTVMLHHSPKGGGKVAGAEIPKRRLIAQNTPAFKLSRETLGQKGLAMDYTLLSSQTNLVLQSDTTYYVSGTVNVNGTLTIEGGTVVKFTNTTLATITSSNVICKTAPYRVAVFTSKDDNAVGQRIGGSSGTPSGYYGNIALDFSSGPSVPLLSNLRFEYLSNALSGISVVLQDSQIVRCFNAFAVGAAVPTMQNVLLYLVNSVYPNLSPQLFVGYNVTAHYCTNFFGNTGGAVHLTNCVFACVTNWQCSTTTTNNDVFLNSDSGVFQTVGAAGHYLAADSPYRNAGTAIVPANVLASLRKKTTYPPIVYTPQNVYVDTTFSAQAQRDTDTIDLGFHYDPLDVAIAAFVATNATITINAGTVVGVYGTNIYTYGFGLDGNGKFVSTGTPSALAKIVAFNTVQEPANTNWFTPSYALVADGFSGVEVGAFCRFTDFCGLAQDVPYFYMQKGGLVNLQDCQFHGGQLTTVYPTLDLTNCLLERVYTDLEASDGNQSVFRNNLIWQGSFYFWPQQTNSIIADNLFDQATIVNLSGLGYNGGFNAYVTNHDRLTPSLATDIILSAAPSYQTGPLGSYYLLSTSSLINADTNTTADKVGLYHYTVMTNLVSGSEIKETNSPVDISYHYVATDSNGIPLDANNDGIPDYLSDANGNGAVDSSEIGWKLNGDLGLKVIVTKPVSNARIP